MQRPPGGRSGRGWGRSRRTGSRALRGRVGPRAGCGERGSVPGRRTRQGIAANRRRAREAGIDLSTVVGRARRPDPERRPHGHRRQTPAASSVAVPDTTEIKVIGVRRVIAERMSEAKRTIPHFSYVEEVDVTELESLRAHLNSKIPRGEPGLTYLPSSSWPSPHAPVVPAM